MPPSEVARNRPAAIAIGQDETNNQARGRVWECTYEASACCFVLDFARRGQPNLNADWIRARLEHYPDQGPVAHLVDGARLDADGELQTARVPHLASLPPGFEPVAGELRRRWGEGWYTFYPEGMYRPAYYNGQGAAARRLEDRYRRTTEGGGPHTDTFGGSGLKAVSINAASHVLHVPAYFRLDRRPLFLAWLAERGLDPDGPSEPPFSVDAEASRTPTKWPKEVKPSLSAVMQDNAVFNRAARRLSTAVFAIGDDAADYFNQLFMATP